MKHWVLDASVLVKWALPSPTEPDGDHADEFLRAFIDGEIALIQPPHWLAEVAAVAARLAPDTSQRILALLHAMDIRVDRSLEAHEAGRRLAVQLGHHPFDTLYHGVALANPDATLVTADEAYFRKARSVGRIVRLGDSGPAPES